MPISPRIRHWLHGLVAAFIGGGASAITSGVASMGIAPDKFNLTDLKGVGHLLAMIGANFLISGILSMAFFLKQSPLPAEPTGNTETFIRGVPPGPAPQPPEKPKE